MRRGKSKYAPNRVKSKPHFIRWARRDIRSKRHDWCYNIIYIHDERSLLYTRAAYVSETSRVENRYCKLIGVLINEREIRYSSKIRFSNIVRAIKGNNSGNLNSVITSFLGICWKYKYYDFWSSRNKFVFYLCFYNE